ncbi:MAG: hypothetical protein AAGI23_01715 [Bacteroidota bacterium]
MKTKLVLWGKNAEEQRVLVAIELKPETNMVGTYVFPETVATDDFANTMMQQWRDGKEVAIPEEHTYSEQPLSVTERIIPEGLSLERNDLLTRAQTEWHFVVLSAKLHDVYDAELNDLKEKIQQLSQYDSKVWGELKGFWDKVRGQIKEQNLFREHADKLQKNTNELFSRLKELRASMEATFQKKSTEAATAFGTQLEEIEGRIEEGSHLSTVFEDLKKMQRRFKETKFTREDRSKVWERLDAAFKNVKEKRFGPQTDRDNSATGRLDRRMQGLMQAMQRMEKSIARDKDDLKFQERKIAKTDGQLEAQIRQAKVQMIEERIRSKEERLADMNKTKAQIERQQAKQAERDAKRAEREKVEAAKQEAKAKIDAQAAAAANEMEEQAADLEKAAEAIKQKKEAPKQEETLMSAVSEVVSETVEDVTDTLKAVASVVGAKAKEAFDEMKEVSSETAEQVRARGEKLADQASEKMADAKEAVSKQVDAAKAKATAVQEQAKESVANVQETVSEQAAEAKATATLAAEEATAQTKDTAEAVKEEVTEQATTVSETVKEEIAATVDAVKAEEVETTEEAIQEEIAETMEATNEGDVSEDAVAQADDIPTGEAIIAESKEEDEDEKIA